MNLISLFFGIAFSCCCRLRGNRIPVITSTSANGGKLSMGPGEGIVSFKSHADRSDLKVEKCGPHYNFYKYAADGSAIYLESDEVYSFKSKDILVLVHTPDDEFRPINITAKVSDEEFIKSIAEENPSATFVSRYIHDDGSLPDNVPSWIDTIHNFGPPLIYFIVIWALAHFYKHTTDLLIEQYGSFWVDHLGPPALAAIYFLAIGLLNHIFYQ